jgi:hypothetical protein
MTSLFKGCHVVSLTLPVSDWWGFLRIPMNSASHSNRKTTRCSDINPPPIQLQPYV